MHSQLIHFVFLPSNYSHATCKYYCLVMFIVLVMIFVLVVVIMSVPVPAQNTRSLDVELRVVPVLVVYVMVLVQPRLVKTLLRSRVTKKINTNF